MPYCKKCGSIASDKNAQFCTRCGSALEREDDPLERNPRPLQEISEPVPKKRRWSFKRIEKEWLIVLGVGGFILLGIIASLCESPEAESPPSTYTPTSTPMAIPTQVPTPAKAIQTADKATPIPTSTPVPTLIPTATPVSGCTGLVISGSEFATMTKSEFEQRLRKEGCSEQQISNMLTTFDDDKQRQARWVEQWDHWANVDAFAASMKEINADRVIDKDESARICFLLDQWTTQMEEARHYVVNYRKVEPDTVEKNSGLGNLQTEAERGLALLHEIECK